jgi:hypothetical protein
MKKTSRKTHIHSVRMSIPTLASVKPNPLAYDLTTITFLPTFFTHAVFTSLASVSQLKHSMNPVP